MRALRLVVSCALQAVSVWLGVGRGGWFGMPSWMKSLKEIAGSLLPDILSNVEA